MLEGQNQLPTGIADWNIVEIRKRRARYLALFILMIACNVMLVIAGNIHGFLIGKSLLIPISLVVGILFLIIFDSVAKQVLGYSTGMLIFISFIILFIPFASLITIAIVDNKIYAAIKGRQDNIGMAKRQLCSLAIFSILLFILPVIGLPLAALAIRRISKSEGQLYGKTLAVTGRFKTSQ